MGRVAGCVEGRFRQVVLGCRELGHKCTPAGFKAGIGLFRFAKV